MQQLHHEEEKLFQLIFHISNIKKVKRKWDNSGE